VAERFSCARTSWHLQEPLLATASQVRRWVLVEQPGSWGRDALLESGLPAGVGEELTRRCRDLRARPLLIRRGGGRDDGSRRVFVASSAAGASWLERFDLDGPDEVLDLDLTPLAEDRGVGGERVEPRLLLTCTNGRHDACCAEFGRGVATALDEHLGEAAWECSHIGGDRFAANVLALPQGVYYGRVSVAAAVGIARLHAEGRLSLPHYRGRSVWAFDVQAAETLLRLHLGADGIEDVVPVAVDRARPGTARVELQVDDQRWRVELEITADPREQRMTCSATTAGCPPRYTAREIAPVAAGGSGVPASPGPR
jgi:hypothetical protein